MEVRHVLTMKISYEAGTTESMQLPEGIHIVGRDSSCDVVIKDRLVSRSHAKIEVTRRGAEVAAAVEDLNSRNGTLVNEERITRRDLSAGDVLRIGKSTITFEGLSRRMIQVESADPAESDSGVSTAGEVGQTMIVGTLDARRVGRGEDVREGQVSPDAVAHRLALIYEVAEKMCGRLTVPELGDSFLEVLLDAFGGADRAMLLLARDGSAKLTPLAVRARGAATGEAGVSQTVVETVMRQGRSVLCRDTASDQRFSASQSLLDLRIRSVMCAPLLASGRVIGMVEVDSLHGASTFHEDDLRLLTGLASQVAIAVENASLYGRLEQSRRLAAIGEAVAGVAHCVKNVLNGIEGGLFIARKGLETGNGEKSEKGWAMLERNSSFLKALVLDMLDYSKEQVIERVDTDLDSLLSEVLALVEGKAAQGDVSVSVGVDPALERAVLDSKRVKRALVNIAGNAVEATPAGGSVRISATPSPGDTFTICVTDTGSGIPEDALEQIFEPFYSTKGSKGTGLGLPVARKIVEEHRGRLACESVVGQGTTFKITLPIG